jgi:hypothetical protein
MHQVGRWQKAKRANRARTAEGIRPGDHIRRAEGDREEAAQPGPAPPPDQSAGGSGQARISRVEDGALTRRQCSVMAALETAAHPHHTEANPETVS